MLAFGQSPHGPLPPLPAQGCCARPLAQSGLCPSARLRMQENQLLGWGEPHSWSHVQHTPGGSLKGSGGAREGGQQQRGPKGGRTEGSSHQHHRLGSLQGPDSSCAYVPVTDWPPFHQQEKNLATFSILEVPALSLRKGCLGPSRASGDPSKGRLPWLCRLSLSPSWLAPVRGRGMSALCWGPARTSISPRAAS